MVVMALGRNKIEGQGGQMFVTLDSALHYQAYRVINVIVAFPSHTVPFLLLGESQVLTGLTH